VRVGLPEGPHATFQLVRVLSLTRRTVAEVLDRADQPSQQRIFVSYRQSSAEARDALRAAGISFAGDDDRVFVRAPGILVERDERTRAQPAKHWELGAGEETSVRNPFAKRSSRVARWLLLHHTELFSVSELANAVDLNPAAVSRVVRALEEAAFVRKAKPDAGGRRRNVHLERPCALLDAWLPLWERRRVRYRHWDIGARDVDEALGLLRAAFEDGYDGWAIGGLAGCASEGERALEAADAVTNAAGWS
jgi:DNA-binding transcriptional ArsR family regulator